MRGFVKDPDATLDYSIDWSLWLGTDTISASTWVADSGITIVSASESFDTTSTRLFVSGGAPGEKYTLTNQITTAGGKVDERSIEIRVRNR